MDDKTISGIRTETRDSGKPGNSGRYFLTMISGHGRDFGKIYRFSGSITIGRSSSNDLVIHNDQVSKKHCRLTPENHDGNILIKITDLDSTNGLFVNGRRETEVILHSGAKIEVGDTILKFGYNDEIEEEFQSRIFNYATIDHLTGLYNKRFVEEELRNQCRISGRNSRIFSIILIDIDDLKEMNERYGHLGADRYLMEFAKKMKDTLRGQDLAGRFGGDEFLVILPETTVDGALKLLHRLKTVIENLEVHYKEEIIRSTFCAGISQFILHGREATTLVEVADKALFKAKRSGKNAIVNAKINYE